MEKIKNEKTVIKKSINCMKTKKEKKKRIFFQYESEQIKNALDAIRGGMKVKTARSMYNVPLTTIRNKVNGKQPETTGKIRSPVLGKQLEAEILQWIKNTARMGFPINREGLAFSIKNLIEEAKIPVPFKGDTPGRKWFNLFLRRYPDISLNQSEYINRARSIITESKFREWFEETAELLGYG